MYVTLLSTEQNQKHSAKCPFTATKLLSVGILPSFLSVLCAGQSFCHVFNVVVNTTFALGMVFTAYHCVIIVP